MKKFFTLALSALVMAGLSTSCSDSDNGEDVNSASQKEEALAKAADHYVNRTVLPTYKGMADAAIELDKHCRTILAHHSAGTLATSDISNAAEAWKESRRYWELSEAFLFGPAADHNIDPHIDS